jgi:hypothetical protein
MKRERTDEERVRALLDFLDEDDDREPGKELPDTTHMTDEQLEKALAAAGIDVEAENRKAEAQHEAAKAALAREQAEATKAETETRVSSPPKAVEAAAAVEFGQGRGRRWMVPLGIAAGFAVAFAVAGPSMLASIQGPHGGPSMRPDGSPRWSRATELLAEAKNDYGRGEWQASLTHVEEAMRLDPVLASDEEVVNLRAAAAAKLMDEREPKIDARAKEK